MTGAAPPDDSTGGTPKHIGAADWTEHPDPDAGGPSGGDAAQAAPLELEKGAADTVESPRSVCISVGSAQPTSSTPLPERSCELESLERRVAKLDAKVDAEAEVTMAALEHEMTRMRKELVRQCCEEVAGACEEILLRCCDEAVLRIESHALPSISEEAGGDDEEVQNPASADIASIAKAVGRSSCSELSGELVGLHAELGELRASAYKTERLLARQVSRLERDMAGLRMDFQAWSATASCELDLLRDEFRELSVSGAPFEGVQISPPLLAVAPLGRVGTEDFEPEGFNESVIRPTPVGSSQHAGLHLRGRSDVGFSPRAATARPSFPGALSGSSAAPALMSCDCGLERTDTGELDVLAACNSMDEGKHSGEFRPSLKSKLRERFALTSI